jgi:hypothetical protein
MLRSPLAALALALALASCVSTDTLTDDTVGTMDAAMQTPPMPQPTRQHQELLQSVGTWEGTLTSFVPGVPAEPTPARETVEALGGFWTQSTFECEFMGMPYVGSGCFGYDEAKGKYVGTWIDNMSSMLAVMEGELAADGKTLVMRWRAPDWDGQMTDHRSETVHTANSSVSTFYMGEGQGEKTMVIEMKRVKETGATERTHFQRVVFGAF